MVSTGRDLVLLTVIIALLLPQAAIGATSTDSSVHAEPPSLTIAQAHPPKAALPTTFLPYVMAALEPDVPLPEPGAEWGGRIVEKAYPLLHAILLASSDPTVDASLIANLPTVRYAAPDVPVAAAGLSNDPLVDRQEHLVQLQIGQAWQHTTGNGSVRLAVIDSGIDADHPDLADQVGQVRDFIGDGFTHDQCAHGTHVAGLAAAVTGNAVGIAGMTDATILSARVLRPDPLVCLGSASDAAEALLWAADEGAAVATLSLTTNTDHAALRDAVKQADAAGVLIVGAGGNTYGEPAAYPAKYAEVLSVGSLDKDGALADFSPASGVDLVAPGESLLSTLPDSYGRMTGTSMSTPLVAATGILIKSHVPEATNRHIRDVLLNTGRIISNGLGYGYGGLDPGSALEAATQIGTHGPYIGPYQTGIVVAGRDYSWTPYSADLDYDPLTFTSTDLPAGAQVDPSDGTLTWTPTASQEGSHTMTVSVSDGSSSMSRAFTIIVAINQPPTVDLEEPQATFQAGYFYQLDATGSSDPDGTMLTYEWDKSDRDGLHWTTLSAKPSFKWNQLGTHIVRLQITDQDGATDQTEITVNIDDRITGAGSFASSFGARARITGFVTADWIGDTEADVQDIQVRITRSYQGIGLLGEHAGDRYGDTYEGGQFVFPMGADGRAYIDLPQDIQDPDLDKSRNLPGQHTLHVTLWAPDSFGGDEESYAFDVPYMAGVL